MTPPPTWSSIQPASTKIQKRIRGVGRIEHGTRAHAGTGFLIEPNAILTNNHVVCLLLKKPLKYWKDNFAAFEAEVEKANAAWADPADVGPGFERWAEDGVAKSTRVRIVGVRKPQGDADYAVLELADKPAGAEVVELSKTAIAPGKDVYVIGCPGEAFPSNWLATEVRALLFGPETTLGTKRFSPGRVLGVQADILSHDASTLAGSSGSCIVDAATHKVVALHASGLDANTVRGTTVAAQNLGVALWEHQDDPLLAKAKWK
jgi:hypothetical protein